MAPLVTAVSFPAQSNYPHCFTVTCPFKANHSGKGHWGPLLIQSVNIDIFFSGLSSFTCDIIHHFFLLEMLSSLGFWDMGLPWVLSCPPLATPPFHARCWYFPVLPYLALLSLGAIFPELIYHHEVMTRKAAALTSLS